MKKNDDNENCMKSNIYDTFPILFQAKMILCGKWIETPAEWADQKPQIPNPEQIEPSENNYLVLIPIQTITLR